MSDVSTTAGSNPFALWPLVGLLLIAGASAFAAAPVQESSRHELNAALVLGPSECSDCHSEEFEIWSASAHERGSKLLTRSEQAQSIASALGVKRIKDDARCTTCHFTLAGDDNDHAKAISGVSCESCHGAAADWIDIHNDFGPSRANARTEADEHRTVRQSRCDENGMLRPSETHLVADRCFACHTIADEELVAAGHPTGAGFELVAWSQGEMRHNFVRGGGKSNALASLEHRRHLYVIGQMLALQHAAEALAGTSATSAYADDMTSRARAALEHLTAIAEATQRMEIQVVVATAAATVFEPGFDAGPLCSAISDCAAKLQMNGALTQLEAVDAFLPGDDAIVGAPVR